MILKSPVNYGGRLYAIGENVRGKLPPDYLDLLRANGHILDIQATEEPKDEVEQDSTGQVATGDSLPELIKHIEASEDMEELDRLHAQEKSKSRPRSGALKAIEKRLAELEQAANSQSLGNLVDDE